MGDLDLECRRALSGFGAGGGNGGSTFARLIELSDYSRNGCLILSLLTRRKIHSWLALSLATTCVPSTICAKQRDFRSVRCSSQIPARGQSGAQTAAL